MLLEDANALATRDDLKVAINSYRSATPSDRVQRISTEIANLSKDNVALVIVDQGALIEDTGMFKAQVASVFDAVVKSHREPYVVIIQRRRPPLSQTTGTSRIESFAVQPLSLDATRRLLIQSLKSAKLLVPADDVLNELTPYLSGYPRAVQLAIGYSQRYGLDALVADKSSLVDLKVRTFERILEKLQLDALDQLILRMLGMEPGLSLDVLATMTNVSPSDLAPRVTKLIDHSVIVRYADTLSLAAPMRDSVYREFRVISSNEYSTLAQRLKDRYWKDTTALPSLYAIDTTLYTVARGRVQELIEFADIILPSTLLKVATTAYHDRDWKVARDFAQRTIEADPSLDSAWSILAKAYIRLAHEGSAEWSQAEAAVYKLKERKDTIYHYLAGFLNWKRGNLKGAVEEYILAEKLYTGFDSEGRENELDSAVITAVQAAVEHLLPAGYTFTLYLAEDTAFRDRFHYRYLRFDQSWSLKTDAGLTILEGPDLWRRAAYNFDPISDEHLQAENRFTTEFSRLAYEYRKPAMRAA